MPYSNIPYSFRLLLLLAVLSCFPHAKVAAENFTVVLDNNRLSLTATRVPLQAILLELAAQGIVVKIDPQFTPSITAHFSNRPIEQALDSIVKPANYSLFWKKDPYSIPADSFVISEVQIFHSGEKDRIRPLIVDGGTHGQIVKNDEGIFYVKNEILLNIPPGTDLQKLHKLLRSFGATLVSSKTLSGIVKITLPDESDVFAISEAIKQTLGLELVEPNYAYSSHSPVRYAGDLPQADEKVPTDSSIATDNYPSIAILDSGFEKTAGLDPVVLFSLNATDPDAEISDTLGHGTQMALIASGLITPYSPVKEKTYPAPIIPIKVFDDDGFTTSVNIMESIDFALINGAKVMSLSWGTEVKSDFLESAFNNASSSGLVIIASAGNEPTGNPIYPAAYSSVIGVGALSPDGGQWPQSNYGEFVSLYAPGVADMPVGHNGDPGVYAGTSISAALVANSAASYLADHPNASQQDIASYLQNKYQ